MYMYKIIVSKYTQTLNGVYMWRVGLRKYFSIPRVKMRLSHPYFPFCIPFEFFSCAYAIFKIEK